jgi:NAD(P)-dependent dehydrogenase (short-subunit alcohol dehydrogenase family)
VTAIEWPGRLRLIDRRVEPAGGRERRAIVDDGPKRALVTGASRGIGRAIAVGLAEAGYDVAITARTMTPAEAPADETMPGSTKRLVGSLEDVAAEIASLGRSALPVRMDLTDLASVDAAIDRVQSDWGSLDLVVNNGRHLGPGISERILETPIEEYGKFLMAHAIAPTLIAQRTLPGMSERGSGVFITFNPKVPPGSGGSGLAYRMGKAAGHTVVGSLVAEYRDAGVRAYNIDPGAVVTERNADRLAGLGYDLSHAVHPEDIARVVVWLVTSPADEVDARYQFATVSALRLIRELGAGAAAAASSTETTATA